MAEPHVPVSRNRLCCRLCSDLLREPVTIPCGHNFCLRCIDRSWDGVRSDFSCPECHRRFPSRPAPVRNTTLDEVVKDTTRSGKRRERHPAGPPPPKRARSGAEETSGGTWCWRHSSTLDVYCCTDELIICAQCASEDHGGHRIGVVGLERIQKQVELSKIQTELRQILQEQKMEIFEQINLKQEEARETEDHCESVIVRVIECLQKHFLSMRKMIAAQVEEAMARVLTLRTKMEELKKMDAELDRLAQSENSVQFLQKWPKVRSLCGDHLHFFNEDPLCPFEVTKRVVEKLGRQLEDFCNKQFTSIFNTSDKEEEEEEEESEVEDKEERSEVISQFHSQNGINQSFIKKKEEPKTREEFLQYACDLLLDPMTAHKDLTLSGDKEVMLCRQTGPTPAIRSPQRFIHRRQVLCRDGLQGSRCYYEVEMKGDKAEIALTYKGIDRKSSSKTSAFGANANSWSLDRSTSYSVSHRGESVQLTALPRNSRIGVYLDFEAGTLSFFEVQRDKMEFLYKLEAEFTEPLHPGFWLGEKCSIKICELKQ